MNTPTSANTTASTDQPTTTGTNAQIPANLRDSIRFANGNIYTFHFESNANGHWTIHIIAQPSYGERKDDPQSTKRTDRDSSYLISCESALISYAEAKTVAEQWARRTERYLEHGIPLGA